ncbi:MAG: phytoene desaturase family protein, partial [Longimicrobiales bacterium]
MSSEFDSVVVGAGPNGLAAAVELARAGRRVLVAEAADHVGGGVRTAELTLPGFRHDVCSAAHPLGAASPFFRSLPLRQNGLEWLHAPAALAHPLDDEPAALVLRSLDETASGLGDDADAYRQLLVSFVERWDALLGDILAPPHPPRHPLLLARFGARAIRSGGALAGRFAEARTRALIGGLCAHSTIPLERAGAAAVGLVLAAAAHAVGWPLVRGGSLAIADALAAHLRGLGAHIVTGRLIERLDQLPRARDVVLDLTPRQVLRVAGERLPARYRRRLDAYRYGPGVFKLDWALSEPIPWRDAHCGLAHTVHLGGSFEQIAAAERAPWEGRLAERPFVLLTQPSLFDHSRAPAGQHTAW